MAAATQLATITRGSHDLRTYNHCCTTSASQTVHVKKCAAQIFFPPNTNYTAPTVASDDDSIHTTPSLRGLAPLFKVDVDSHFRLEAAEQERPQEQQERDRDLEPSTASVAESPPPFSSHGFPAQYFPEPSTEEPYPLTTACATESLTATAPAGPAPPFPFEETQQQHAAPSTVVAEIKAALPRDTKDGQSSKDLDDGEPPPPYTEGSSPLEGFTYVMAAAGGGAASILTQVQQAGPAPINTSLGGGMY